MECAGEPTKVLTAAAELARERHYKRIEFLFLPGRSKLAVALRRGNCRVESKYRKDGAAMMRIVDLRSTFEHLAPELSRRLQNSHVKQGSGALEIGDAGEAVRLQMAGGVVRVAEHAPKPSRHYIRGGEEIVQLIIGTDEPQATVEGGKIKLS